MYNQKLNLIKIQSKSDSFFYLIFVVGEGVALDRLPFIA